MSFNRMSYDTFFSLAAMAGEPIDKVVDRVKVTARALDIDVSTLETPRFQHWYAQQLFKEYGGFPAGHPDRAGLDALINAGLVHPTDNSHGEARKEI
ncbi:hypothetical protein NWJ54_004484 [Salmonella enterica]|nr:hypothetical protein [Salmonella enterica subsp. enterica serovar Heidelberg]EJS7522858.1 hypothetical protein [Salmonella enterica]